MIATETTTKFLPTDASAFDSPLVVGLMVLAIATAISVFFAIALSEIETHILLLILFGTVLIGGIPFTVGHEKAQEQNEQNIIKNVQVIYDIDKVVFDVDKDDASSTSNDSMPVTVTVGGKAFKSIITQDSDTYEPTLSSFNNDADMEEYKKKP